jgi:hypothetical protein
MSSGGMLDSEIYIKQLREDLRGLQEHVDKMLADGISDSTETDGLYALLHNTKNTAEDVGYGLVTQICSLACGILQRSKDADESCLRAVKAHIDALVIIAEHDLEGDGGPLGHEMVCQLEGLAKAVNA